MSKKYAAIMLGLAPCLIGIQLSAQTAPAPGASAAAGSFNALVDQVIARENGLLPVLRGTHPLAETYIQEMQKDPDFGLAPKTDHYFLGKVDLSNGVTTASLIPKSDTGSRAFSVFSQMFSVRFLPRGFAQMMIVDGAGFDRAHYDFKYLRREFLGDVRTWVIAVTPKKSAGSGRFDGRIWVEDKGDSIVRFSGTYDHPSVGLNQVYLHFDSWRINAGPDLWVPYQIYTEESDMPYEFKLRKMAFKGVTQVWGYTRAEERNVGEFTNMTVEMPAVKDSSSQAADYAPVEAERYWKQQGEDNIIARLEAANMIGSTGAVEKVLDTVVNNIEATNDLQITPEVHVRVLLTTPLETFSIGHTIVISRGLLDTLPDEASLAAMLSYELAHIALGHDIDTKFAFGDRVNFDDEVILKKFRFARSRAQEDAADKKAVELLQKSPYADKLRQAGLFLKALSSESNRLPYLIKPLEGNRLAERNRLLRLAAILEAAPEFQKTRVDQIAALPLGTRTKLDPWSDELRLAHTNAVPLLSAREKMPFEITPVYLHLTYRTQPEQQLAAGQVPAGATPPAANSPVTVPEPVGTLPAAAPQPDATPQPAERVPVADPRPAGQSIPVSTPEPTEPPPPPAPPSVQVPVSAPTQAVPLGTQVAAKPEVVVPLDVNQ